VWSKKDESVMSNDLDKMTVEQAYTKGFVDGASSNSKYPIDSVNILGYSIDDLIKIVIFWQKSQPKELYRLDFNGSNLRVEEVSEGHVVWADGKIVWKSWKD
jgi:hypothetical protein